jgi:L-seryl-tRNA(Ser) seleniumtransferase
MKHAMDDERNAYRNIPQIEKILQQEEVRAFMPLLGQGIVAGVVRDEVSRFRERVKQGDAPAAEELHSAVLAGLDRKRLSRLQRVINGTGVIIHTNLGRSPISPRILEGLGEALSGYCNLEIFLPENRRGGRGGFAEELLSQLAGSEDALVVNNNASSVFLILSEFARGREVVVSRGELVQIGGGFRIPEIMSETGAELVEVGTTNITTLDDYRRALGGNTAMIFSAHRSNFRMDGFTGSPALAELAGLKSPRVLFVRDLGSGNLVYDDAAPPGFEPTVSFELSQGPDLLCFSGDKLLGGCQAGIIVGRKDLVGRLRKNPLMRMLRVDKITYYILQETLLHYAHGDHKAVAVWAIIAQDVRSIDKKIRRLLALVKERVPEGSLVRVKVKSTYGGGSLPGMELASSGLRVAVPGMGAEETQRALLACRVPVAGYILDGAFTLDFRTILPVDLPPLAEALISVAGLGRGEG